MSHPIVIILGKIAALKAATTNPTWIASLDTLADRATILDAKTEPSYRWTPPLPPLEAEAQRELIHEVLEETQGWLEEAKVDDEDFEERLNCCIECMAPYIE